MPLELKATALCSMCCGTSCGVKACCAGIWKARATPSNTETPRINSREAKLNWVAKTSSSATPGDVVHVPGHRHHQHLIGAHARQPGEPKAHELTVGE
jgi:hypothetical protein